jgi:hypothetical protein
MVDDGLGWSNDLAVTGCTAVIGMNVDGALPNSASRYVLNFPVSPISNDALQIQTLSFCLALSGGEISGNRLRKCQDRLRPIVMTLPVFCFDLGCNLRRDFFVSCFSRPAESITGNRSSVVPVAVPFE